MLDSEHHPHRPRRPRCGVCRACPCTLVRGQSQRPLRWALPPLHNRLGTGPCWGSCYSWTDPSHRAQTTQVTIRFEMPRSEIDAHGGHLADAVPRLEAILALSALAAASRRSVDDDGAHGRTAGRRARRSRPASRGEGSTAGHPVVADVQFARLQQRGCRPFRPSRRSTRCGRRNGFRSRVELVCRRQVRW
jgi:hypothetical protein